MKSVKDIHWALEGRFGPSHSLIYIPSDDGAVICCAHLFLHIDFVYLQKFELPLVRCLCSMEFLGTTNTGIMIQVTFRPIESHR